MFESLHRMKQVRDDKLNFDRLEKYLEEVHKDLDLNVNELAHECESEANVMVTKLKSCAEKARLFQCLFAKTRKLAAQERANANEDEAGDSNTKVTKSMKLPNGRTVVTKNNN